MAFVDLVHAGMFTEGISVRLYLAIVTVPAIIGLVLGFMWQPIRLKIVYPLWERVPWPDGLKGWRNPRTIAILVVTALFFAFGLPRVFRLLNLQADALPWFQTTQPLIYAWVFHWVYIWTGKFSDNHRTLLTGFMLGIMFGAMLSSVRGTASERGLDMVYDNGGISRFVLKSLRSMYDADKDGFPTRFCSDACDCDDYDRRTNPGAIEIVGNGLDEDCDNYDLSPLSVARAMPEPLKPSSIEAQRYNIILIVMDTVRADHLSAYGYGHPTSPNMDALASRGRLFTQARSQGPNTGVSLPSLFTGKYFSEVARHRHKVVYMDDSNVTMAEIFKKGGYHTWAISSFGYFREVFGYGQGFEEFDTRIMKLREDVYHTKTSDLVTKFALERIDDWETEATRPFLMVAHYADPHVTYVDHDYGELFSQTVLPRYDEEIRFVDDHVGRLVEGLKRRHLLDDTVIIITSDHGEGLIARKDHGHRYHGQHVYDNLVHIPLIMWVPGVHAGVTDTPVGNIDILPTLLDITGVTTNSRLSGVSLVPFLQNEVINRGPVFMEKGYPRDKIKFAMVDWPYKLHWRPAHNRWELYDLNIDPREKHDLSRSRPKVLRKLRKRFKIWRATEINIKYMR
jgi:arylsulfatase A-like enzyme